MLARRHTLATYTWHLTRSGMYPDPHNTCSLKDVMSQGRTNEK